MARVELRAERAHLGRRLLLPVQEFVRVEERSGVPLLLAAVVALAWANLGAGYDAFWDREVGIDLGWVTARESLRTTVRDGLLPLFFLVVGMEIKHELAVGELSSRTRAALPLAAALGGMLVPAAAYLAVTWGGEHVEGWGVPVATDIAFALAVLALLGKRVPRELKVLVLAFATVDDVGGVLVIALAYSSSVDLLALGVAGGLLAVFLALRVLGVRNLGLYVLSGVALLFAMHFSGVHTTIAAVALGFLTPARPSVDREEFRERAEQVVEQLAEALDREREEHEAVDAAKAGGGEDEDRQHEEVEHELAESEAREAQEALLGSMEELTVGTEAPTDRLVRKLNPWVGYLVLPLFALSHAGLVLRGESLTESAQHPVALGVAAGLVLGKPLGILLFAWVAVRLGLAELPGAVRWHHVVGIGFLAGIGFTVSLFIAELAVQEEAALTAAKLGVLAASVLAGLAGWLYLWLTSRRR